MRQSGMVRLPRTALFALLAAIAVPSFAQNPPPAGGAPPAATGAAPAPTGRPVAVDQPPQRVPGRFRKREVVGVVGGPVATYPGFRMMPDGTSRVWLEVSNKVSVTEHKAPGRLTYSMKGVSAPVRTNRLALLTGWFASPASRIQLVPQADGVDLVIDLRTGSDPTHKISESREGMLLQIDFPKLPQSEKPGPVAGAPRERSKRTQKTRSMGDDSAY